MPTLNGGYRYVDTLGPADAGGTVATFLVTRYPMATEATWVGRIAAGQVHLDGQPTMPDQPLKAGQQLTWDRPPWQEPEVPLGTAILYEDDALLAVAKPSGLPTLPGGGEFLEHTLLNLVRRRHPEANPMHRLGRYTSGIVLFAPTAVAGRALQASFRGPGTRKVYRALCSGWPARDTLEITAPIGEVPHALLGSLHAYHPEGRPSCSRVKVLERRAEGTLLDVEILTGRPHQIRIHLAWVGHPLVGDPLYGPGGIPRPGCRALPGDSGYLLHAHRLELDHPVTGERLRLCCPAPANLRRTFC